MGRFGLSEHEPKRLWELWGQGMAVQDVARRLGARHEYVWRY